jgi:hypothetical protein
MIADLSHIHKSPLDQLFPLTQPLAAIKKFKTSISVIDDLEKSLVYINFASSSQNLLVCVSSLLLDAVFMRCASQHSREAVGKYALRKGSMVLLNLSLGFAHSFSPIVQQHLANLSIVLFTELAREILILPSDPELSILDRALKISIDCAKFLPFQSFNLFQVWDMQFIDAIESSFLKERLLSIQRDDLITRELAGAMSLAGTWNRRWPCDELVFEDVRIRAMKSSLKQRHFSFQHVLKTLDQLFSLETPMDGGLMDSIFRQEGHCIAYLDLKSTQQQEHLPLDEPIRCLRVSP